MSSLHLGDLEWMHLRQLSCSFTLSKAGYDSPTLEFHAEGSRALIHSCFFILYVGFSASNYSWLGCYHFFFWQLVIWNLKHTQPQGHWRDEARSPSVVSDGGCWRLHAAWQRLRGISSAPWHQLASILSSRFQLLTFCCICFIFFFLLKYSEMNYRHYDI